jgi:hypothetical protein
MPTLCTGCAAISEHSGPLHVRSWYRVMRVSKCSAVTYGITMALFQHALNGGGADGMDGFLFLNG